MKWNNDTGSQAGTGARPETELESVTETGPGAPGRQAEVSKG